MIPSLQRIYPERVAQAQQGLDIAYTYYTISITRSCETSETQLIDYQRIEMIVVVLRYGSSHRVYRKLGEICSCSNTWV